MPRSRIGSLTAGFDVTLAVAAEMVAVWFVRTYSAFAAYHISLTVEHAHLAAVHKLFLNKWHFLLILPFTTVILAVLCCRLNCAVGIRILCQIGWLAAFGLVCYSLVVWQQAYLPVVRLYD